MSTTVLVKVFVGIVDFCEIRIFSIVISQCRFQMFHKKLGSRCKTNEQCSSHASKFTEKKSSNNKQTDTTNLNFPRSSNRSSRKDMLDSKLDHLTSVDINMDMDDLVNEVVIMDSDENEDIIPKSPEE